MNVTGIYFFSPVYDISGYGNVARNFLLALEKLNIPVYIHAHGAFDEEIGKDNMALVRRICVASPKDLGDNVVLIQHSDPAGFMPDFVFDVEPIKKIGMTIFETDRICEEWVDKCNSMDEIWIPTKFNYDTFKNSGVDESKLRIVRYPVNTMLFNDSAEYEEMDLGLSGFKFLYVSGYDYRKGYELLIDSFCKAFTKDDDVNLILKLYIPEWSRQENALGKLINYIKKYEDRPNIYISNNKVSQKEMIGLYDYADAYISTERASGWGMPEMEMMAMGKPVATIDWGGTTEYMNSSNSYPIKTTGEMEYVDLRLQTSRPTYSGHKWACVSPDDVASTLLDIYNNADKREKVSKKAKEDIFANLSPDVIEKEIRRVLEI